MREVGVLEAKTSFTALIAEVERTGEGVLVTRRGKAAVQIVPVRPTLERPTPEQRTAVAKDIIAWRDAQPFDDGLASTTWEDLKRVIRNEDRHD